MGGITNSRSRMMLSRWPPPYGETPLPRQLRPAGRAGKTRVLAIGDAHDGPRIPKDRFRWFGRLAADTQPDVIVQIGDFLSLDSLCRYGATTR